MKPNTLHMLPQTLFRHDCATYLLELEIVLLGV